MTRLSMPDQPPSSAEASVVVPFPLPVDGSVTERAEENEWLLRIKDSADTLAFRRLFERLSPRIHSFFRRDGVTPTDAENALQDVWLVVWRKADQFNPTLASARTWIFTLARNRIIDIDRAARREMRLTSAYVASSSDDRSYEPDFLVQALGGRVARLLSQLPAEQREVLVQCYVEGKSQREIASALGVPIGTIKSRARLAFERIKLLMKEAT